MPSIRLVIERSRLRILIGTPYRDYPELDVIARAVRQPSPHSEASSSVNNLYGQYS